MPNSAKYPRTFHFPFSPGKSNDDKVQHDLSFLLNTPLVITEKMDGSCVSMSSTDIFARTHSGPPKHKSFDSAKAIHASIKHLMPEGLDFFGEYVYAKHSIEYTELPGYFLLFGIRDNFASKDMPFWRSWKTVEDWAEQLGLNTVPALEKTTLSSEKELQNIVEKHMKQSSLYGNTREGVVVRRVLPFSDREFSKAVLKMVRFGHIGGGDSHWLNKKIISNKLKL